MGIRGMKGLHKIRIKRWLVLSVATVLVAGVGVPRPPMAAVSEDPTLATRTTGDDTDNGWPREISNGEQITIYQPQVERWKENQIEERAAVSIQAAASSQPSYGVIWITARTEVDRENRLVTLENIQISRSSFPGEPEQAGKYLEALKKQVPALVRHIALDRLQASLALTRAESGKEHPALKNTPPKIIHSTTPATLVLIDGEPVLRDAGADGMLRVINTRALIVFDKKAGTYFLSIGGRWTESKSLQGPWTLSKSPPASLDKIREPLLAQKQVDPLELKDASLPTIYVSTIPTELIQTEGKPLFQPVGDTSLLFVENSSNDLFLNSKDQNFYLLASGRWYRARTLDSSTWTHVSAKSLPKDFSKIPESHRKGMVLASVAGTPQAQEAGISNSIPQTATVDRSKAQLDVQYDGAPDFVPIPGTPLKRALNTSVPVIEVDAHSFYSVKNGIWFAATSPQGPWAVAAEVPAVIYTIPPSSPVYNVTFVRVYGSTPEVVYVGYTPGYFGSYLSNDGVVVFGTGYYYPPWIGQAWYGYPWTWGFGFGWTWGFGWGYGPAFVVSPWWGPWWALRGTGGYGFYARPRTVTVNVVHTNLYRTWSAPVVRNTWSRTEVANRFVPGGTSSLNNVYAGPNGNVYRHGTNGWETHSGNAWKPVQPPAPAGPNRSFGGAPRSVNPGAGNPGAGNLSAPHSSIGELEQHQSARDIGERNWQTFRGGPGTYHAGVTPPPAAPPPAAPPSGGGFHGGAGGAPHASAGAGGFHGGGGGGFHGGGGGGGHH